MRGPARSSAPALVFFRMSKRRRHAPVRRPPSPGPPPSPPFGNGPAALVVAVAAVAAFAERLWFSRAWGETASLTSAFYYGDATRFVAYAVAIVEGKPFDNGIPFHPPGWPLALAALFHVTGAVRGSDVVVPIGAVKLLLASLSGASVGMAALLAYEMAGPGAMLAVALLGPFHFGHIVEGAVANSEALYGLLMTVSVWAAWRWLRREPGDAPAPGREIGRAALAGACGAAAMLVRAEFLAGALVLALGALWRRRSRPALVAFMVAFAAILTPATVWHYRTLSAFNMAHVGRVAGPLPTLAPVTSYGPFNFAMANHPDADGGPNRDHPMLDQCSPGADAELAAGELDLACPAVYDLYVHGYRIGLGWILNHPGDALALMRRKVAMTIGFLAQGYLFDDAGAGVEGVRRRVDLLDPASWWLLPIHLALVIGGVIVLRRRDVALVVLAAPAAAFAGSILLFYGYVRLGVAYLPIVWIAQGASIAAVAARVRRRPAEWKSLVAGVLAASAILTTLDGVRSRSPRSLVLDGRTTPSGAIVQDETLRVYPAGY